MKEIPKKDPPDIAGGVLPNYPTVPCFPNPWPRSIEDGPTYPEEPPPPCENPPSA